MPKNDDKQQQPQPQEQPAQQQPEPEVVQPAKDAQLTGFETSTSAGTTKPEGK